MTRRLGCSLGIALALLVAGCRPPAAPGATPRPGIAGRAVDVAAFGPLDGPDSLVILPAAGMRPRLPVAHPHFDVPSQRNQSIVIAVVVDTSGFVVPGTVAVLGTSDPAMVRPACEALAREQFIVARPEGRPHPELTVSMWTVQFSSDASPIPDARAVTAALRAMRPADLVRYLATKPGCP